MRVTVTDLKKMHACDEQVELFRLTFPRGANVNQRTLERAIDAGLDVRWFARNYPRTAAFRRVYAAFRVLWHSTTGNGTVPVQRALKAAECEAASLFLLLLAERERSGR